MQKNELKQEEVQESSDWMPGVSENGAQDKSKELKQLKVNTALQKEQSALNVVKSESKSSVRFSEKSRRHLEEWQEHVKERFVRIYENTTYEDQEMHCDKTNDIVIGESTDKTETKQTNTPLP